MNFNEKPGQGLKVIIYLKKKCCEVFFIIGQYSSSSDLNTRGGSPLLYRLWESFIYF